MLPLWLVGCLFRAASILSRSLGQDSLKKPFSNTMLLPSSCRSLNLASIRSLGTMRKSMALQRSESLLLLAFGSPWKESTSTTCRWKAACALSTAAAYMLVPPRHTPHSTKLPEAGGNGIVMQPLDS